MDHAGAEDLDPALTLAGGAALAAALVALHVHLAARLCEREVVRTEAGDGVLTVELFHERVERALQVRHRDALVDDHALDLVEHGGMGGVHLVLAVHAARSENTDGQRARLHRVDLHGRGLRAQQDGAVLGEVERVRPLAGGVSLEAVELGEVVVGGLDLAVLENFKAHADEDVLDLVEHLIHRVLFADLHGLAGDGDVHRLGLELHLQRFCGQLLRARLHALLELGAHLVGKLADDRALLRAELAHLLEDSGQLAPLAEVLHAQRLKILRLLRAADGLKGFDADGF